jgi:hypothetical protein
MKRPDHQSHYHLHSKTQDFYASRQEHGIQGYVLYTCNTAVHFVLVALMKEPQTRIYPHIFSAFFASRAF